MFAVWLDSLFRSNWQIKSICVLKLRYLRSFRRLVLIRLKNVFVGFSGQYGYLPNLDRNGHQIF